MTTPEQPEKREHQHALTDIEQASTAMVRSTDAPAGFHTVFAGLVATLLTLSGLAAWSTVLAVATLSIPLMLWYFLYMRTRAKPRSVLRPSKAHYGYLLVLILLTQFIRFWEVSSWVEAAAQWLVIFVVFWVCMAGMRGASHKDRVREAHGSHR